MTANKFIAFLRGINVGGHHKVPMAELRLALEQLGFEQVITLLNSGNIIFDAPSSDPNELEAVISEKLASTFGFPVPTIIRKANMIQHLFDDAPFQDIEIHKDIRLYVSFLMGDNQSDLELPWTSSDSSFSILSERNKTIISVLDLSVTKTPKAMEIMEKSYGKDITTRNWKTIERIVAKL